MSYNEVNRNSTKTITKDINIGNHVYTKNAYVGAFANNHILRFSYGYSVIQNPKFELGLLVGIHLINYKLRLQAISNVVSINLKDTFGMKQAIPDSGIWGGYVFSNRFAVNGEINCVSATISNFSGFTIGSSLKFLYQVSNHFDIALGYAGFNFKLKKSDPKYIKSLKWNYNGPAIFATFSFGKK